MKKWVKLEKKKSAPIPILSAETVIDTEFRSHTNQEKKLMRILWKLFKFSHLLGFLGAVASALSAAGASGSGTASAASRAASSFSNSSWSRARTPSAASFFFFLDGRLLNLWKKERKKNENSAKKIIQCPCNTFS